MSFDLFYFNSTLILNLSAIFSSLITININLTPLAKKNINSARHSQVTTNHLPANELFQLIKTILDNLEWIVECLSHSGTWIPSLEVRAQNIQMQDSSPHANANNISIAQRCYQLRTWFIQIKKTCEQLLCMAMPRDLARTRDALSKIDSYLGEANPGQVPHSELICRSLGACLMEHIGELPHCNSKNCWNIIEDTRSTLTNLRDALKQGARTELPTLTEK